MLFELINANREVIVQRVCERASFSETASADAIPELTRGVAAFVSQLSDLLFLRHADPAASDFERRAEMSRATAEHGEALLRHGFTLAQVVHDYTEIGRAIVEIATERQVTLSHDDFLTVYLSVNAAVAGAVTEHAHRVTLRERNGEWETAPAGNHIRSHSR